MSHKRDKPYLSRHVPFSPPKRRRPLPPPQQPDNRPEYSSDKSPAKVVLIGLPPDCSLLDIRSRFQIYGCISRTTMHHPGVASVTFRSKASAESAIAASLDPSFGITLDSKPVQVMWAADPVPHWREGVSHKDSPNSSSSLSKLVRAEVPLRRHGRGNKLGSAIGNPRKINSDLGLALAFKGREIVAYDDIL